MGTREIKSYPIMFAVALLAERPRYLMEVSDSRNYHVSLDKDKNGENYEKNPKNCCIKIQRSIYNI